MPTRTATKKAAGKSSNPSTSKTSRTSKNNSSKTPSRGRSQASASPGNRPQTSGSSRSRQASGSDRQSSSGSASSTSKLQEFFVDELKDIYWAEKQLVKTLPKLQKAATSEELQQAFGNHRSETEGHVERLEQAFEMLGQKAQAKKCDAMQGITEEGASVIEDTDKGTSTRDVGLIMAGQKAEHYEIATYGGLIQIAKTLGRDDIARLLQQTLEEEKKADQLLTQIAESKINYVAAGEDEEE
jgi:ferritin-like metal-binding protein YciE